MIIQNKYIYKFLLSLALPLMMGGCADDTLDLGKTGSTGSNGVSYTADGNLKAPVQIEIPGMSSLSTRSMGETPNYEDLELYLLVFEEGEGLRQCSKFEPKAPITDAEKKHNALVTFDLTLAPTTNPAVVHLVATDQPDFDKQIMYGPEDRVMSDLITTGGSEAYWQRIDLEGHIPSKEQSIKELKDSKWNQPDEDQAEEIMNLLRHVPMIRNFCRVSVNNQANNFTLTGLYAVNTVDRGSVAPYVIDDAGGKKFIEYFDGVDTDNHYKGKSYADVSKQGHIGTLPAGVKVINTVEESVQKYADNVSPVYFYERPARVNSTERTYIIISGKCNNGNEKYYKIDLGYLDDIEDLETGRGDEEAVGYFTYYNLLRNFDYKINISSVDPNAGYETFDEATRGVVFNNFGASVEARNMTNIGDGEDMIRVNFTSYVFATNKEKVKLKAQYRIDGGKTVNNDHLYIKWNDGDVITAVSGKSTVVENGEYWVEWEITGPDQPTDVLKQQTLYVYRGKKADGTFGLYRVITFFSHTPWQFLHIDTFPGHLEDWNPDWEWTDIFREIGPKKDAKLTLFFELPGGLPQAIFPLDFAIEADRQNIQNAYVGNAVVTSVRPEKSLFATNPTLPTDDEYNIPTTARIQYVKTVSWEEYYGGDQEQVGKGSQIVRARFLTITDLEHDLVGSAVDGTGMIQSTTTLRVYNPYFKDKEGNPYHQDGFERYKEEAANPTLTWNFSETKWDSELAKMNSRYDIFDNTKQYTGYSFYKDNTDYNGLRFIDGKTKEQVYTNFEPIDKPTIRSGTYPTGYDYVQLNKTTDSYEYKRRFGLWVDTETRTVENITDIIRRKYSYSSPDWRVMRISVMSSNDNNESAAPRVRVTYGSNNTEIINTSDYSSTNTTTPFTTYIYDVQLQSEYGTDFTIDIMNPNENNHLRVYQISINTNYKP